ncbi:MAG TPA: SDR family NAD(P)-dependent oxidoreductase [Thermodesulfobacteriota bacterium]|nr:SDR family NAD(P)-dependent oxidoreductase [Thermodesulfobacteriota bacterium]
MRFAGQVVIVTGAGRPGQVGETLAHAFGREGARVVVAARTEGNVRALADRLAAEGIGALAVAADLAEEAGAQHLAERTLEAFGRIDVLVNLAGGLTVIRPAVELSLAEFQRELASNLVTAFLCARAVIPAMQRAGRGRIVNFASAAAQNPLPRLAAYNCAKAGVVALTRTLAQELKDTDITVNAIAPGLIDTEANRTALQPSPEELRRRWVTREAVAQATLFLASDAAAGVTGQVLTVAGRGI